MGGLGSGDEEESQGEEEGGFKRRHFFKYFCLNPAWMSPVYCLHYILCQEN